MPAPPEIAAIAPDFALVDSEGTWVELAGRCTAQPQVLVFYRGHW